MQRARLPQTRAKGEYEMENTIKVLQHKESKLSACRQSFKEHEALVYHQLTNLIRDTVWLKSYLSGGCRRTGSSAAGGLMTPQSFPAAPWLVGRVRRLALALCQSLPAGTPALLQRCCACRPRRSKRPMQRWGRCAQLRCRHPPT